MQAGRKNFQALQPRTSEEKTLARNSFPQLVILAAFRRWIEPEGNILSFWRNCRIYQEKVIMGIQQTPRGGQGSLRSGKDARRPDLTPRAAPTKTEPAAAGPSVTWPPEPLPF